MIQVIYTPNLCVFQKRSSRMQLNNLKTDKYERCCTFDGPDYFSVAQHMKGDMSQFMKRQTEKMIEYLQTVSFIKFDIKKIHLYYKLDKNNKLWFLYAGGAVFQE